MANLVPGLIRRTSPFSRRAMVVLALTCVVNASNAAEPTSKPIDFNREIRPILSNHCFQCHGPDARKRKGVSQPLRLDNEAGALADLGGYRVIVKGDPEQSDLIQRLQSDDPSEVMPPPNAGKRLSAVEIARLTEWVKQGANYSKHWAYVKPDRPPLPAIKDANWPKTGADAFILARLEREGLKPSRPADPSTLIRRVSLDLTGLPPTPDEVDRFVNDPSAGAYDRLVDRLLDSPAYGEHWARAWLDLARYADSAGYADDPPRTIWAYRDYVIRSLNANRPFDQFTIEQIAGDLLPDPTEDQVIATAFHRNTLTNNEGGTNDEEFRNVAIVDRVNTTLAVWMGTTIACAQCHDHKYDPFTQEEYFRLFSIFNNTADADRGDESPLLPLYRDGKKAGRDRLTAEIERLKATHERPELIPALNKQVAALPPSTTVPVLRELPANGKRTTRIQFRGNFNDLGPEVAPGLPAVFPGLPAGVPVDRLSLARWLVDAENPMTGRVIANRCWEQIFGVGLVPTPEEFGTQGEPPTHPELLDWLATELVGNGWNMKAFLKLLVTSAAYRQDSAVTPELLRRDPDDRLLTRGPRFRLPAETVRDQALFVAGLLSPAMFGPPVKPPQPSVGLSAAFGGGIDWQTSPGQDKYRRALYTTWRRSNPYPSMATFDAPNREVCVVKRTPTNTPLQALVTLNDPVYVEAAQALGRRINARDGSTSDRVRHGFRLCLAREPTEAETVRLVQLFETVRASMAREPGKALSLATVPLGPQPAGSNVADLAAWTVVGNVVLNLDEMLMKR